ncbi:MAG: hypothetical protein IJW77_11305 [Clostridia bacterium]|nr:hypothetical protein [Clostridia bacterium]
MNFRFQEMKPVMQADMDAVLQNYPTDLGYIRAQVPADGEPYTRRTAIIELTAAQSDVHIYPHYPFAFELDMGVVRDNGYSGIGDYCFETSGADMGPLHDLMAKVNAAGLGSISRYTDTLHNTLDHDKLLSVGFRGVYEECEAYNREETDPEKRWWREMVMRACRAVEHIGLRLRARAKEMLPDAPDEDARYNLARIVSSVNTPWEPPQTLFDAMNAILCTTLWISGLDGVEMNAYGQIDRLLQPFYERDLAAGRITREEAYFLLQSFLYKTDLHCHFNEERKTYDNGVSAMIGGCDPDGNPIYNDMTDMVLDAYTENRLINPKLNARASSGSPRAYLARLAALMKTGNNNLVIENDDYIIPMFERMGLSPEDARTYVGNGCQEVICRNMVHSRAFIYLNLPQVLLDTVYSACHGESLSDDKQQFYRYASGTADTFDDLYALFLSGLHSYIRVIAETLAPYERRHHEYIPSPMLSSFTADCTRAGTDISNGGARYNHKTLSFVGFGTLCDSLLALRAAYDNGTLTELLDAVKSDFADCEPYRLHLKSSDNRFGHSASADAFAADLACALSHVADGIVNGRGIPWGTSLFTYYQYSWFGKRTGATPDGRHAHEIFSRQMNMASPPSLTEAARSMSVLCDADFHDVGMYDIAIPCTVTDSSQSTDALTAYIAACLELKIPVLQPNVADRKTMVEERDHKGTHPDLVVRICGYSAMFAQLSREMQDELIARTGSV